MAETKITPAMIPGAISLGVNILGLLVGGVVAWATLVANEKHNVEHVDLIDKKNETAITEMKAANLSALTALREDAVRRNDKLDDTLEKIGVRMQANREDIVRLWASIDAIKLYPIPPHRK